MPIMSSASQFDEIVEKTTLETLTSENWALVLEICDQVNQGGAKAAKDCLLSIRKRLNHRDPHVTLLALSLLDSCMSNCSKTFHNEVCSREFAGELRSKATGSNAKIAERTRFLIKKWCEEVCKKEPSLSLLPALFNELVRDGFEFVFVEQKTTAHIPVDPSFATSQQEAEDIARAIHLSLQQKGGSGDVGGKTSASDSKMNGSSLYPLGTSNPQRAVKALYDFEAAEDNELTFKAGELITVTDDSDVNWWKGQNHRGEGLFPASFVTTDMSAQIESAVAVCKASKKSVQFDDRIKVKHVDSLPDAEPTVIDDAKLSRCLELFQNIDPSGERNDPDELIQLEGQCNAMLPLIDAELENIDRNHSSLAEMNTKLMDALNLYHVAMKDASIVYQQQISSMMQPPQMYASTGQVSSEIADMYGRPQMPVPYPSDVVSQQFGGSAVSQFSQSQASFADQQGYSLAVSGHMPHRV